MRKSLLKLLIPAASILFLNSCGIATFPNLNRIREKYNGPLQEQFSPSPIFRMAYNDACKCTHLSGNFDDIKWFHVKTRYINCRSETGKCYGQWTPPHNIYISNEVFEDLNYPSLPSEFFKAVKVLEHEDVHDLRQDTSHTEIFSQCGLAFPN